MLVPRVSLMSSPLSTVTLSTLIVALLLCCVSGSIPQGASRSSLYAQGPAGTLQGAGDSAQHSHAPGTVVSPAVLIPPRGGLPGQIPLLPPFADG